MIGIYKIEHIASGRMYIGSSNNMKTRWRKHKEALRRGGHHSKYLQRLWDKYGEESIKFQPIIICSVDTLKEYEQRCIDGLAPVLNGSKSANAPVFRGQSLPDEWREKVAQAVRQRYADGFKIVHPPRSAAYKLLISKQSLARWTDPAIRAKNIAAIQRSMTEEEKHNRSIRAKALWANPEYRAKSVAARKGNSYSKGYKCTPEQVNNRKRAARISNMKRNYGSNWAGEYARRYPEYVGDLDAF